MGIKAFVATGSLEKWLSRPPGLVQNHDTVISPNQNLVVLAFVTLLFWRAANADAAPATVAGATVPWTTYKAEHGVTTGERLTSRTYGEIANEALGHNCIRLAATGQHITWKVRSPANALVIRACVPDAPQGGGTSHTLTIAINGMTRQKITLSSLHSWLYGKNPNGHDNAPGTGTPHAFFEESREFLSGPPLKSGDTITLHKQETDTAAWYVIDLIDLELVAPPPQMPDNCLSVTDFGAVPDDGKDDTAAFAACLKEARAKAKTAWVPAGTFHQNQPMSLSGVKVRGAGLWHTHLVGMGEFKPNYFPGNVGFKLSGDDVEVSGFSIDGSLTTRSNNAIQHGISGSADRFRIEDIWVRHTTTGAWIGPCSNGVVRRCRFRDTYADGLNINNHSESVLVEENHSRGNGDDGLAVFAGTDKAGSAGPCRNITLKRNTIEGQRWGNGLGVYGGDAIGVEANLIISANRCAGITVSTGFNSWPMNGASITGNVLIDCGGTAYDQQYPAIHIHVPGKDLQGLMVKGNTIRGAAFNAINIAGSAGGGQLDGTLAENSIESSGGNGIKIYDSVRGRLTLQSNKITSQNGKEQLVNLSKPAQLNLASDLK
jgi:hypothetical protein